METSEQRGFYLIPEAWRHAAETPPSYLDLISSSLRRLLVCCRGASVSVSVDGFLSNRQVEPH